MVIFVVAVVNVLDQGISVTDTTTVEMDQMKLTAVSNCIRTYVRIRMYMLKKNEVNYIRIYVAVITTCIHNYDILD